MAPFEVSPDGTLVTGTGLRRAVQTAAPPSTVPTSAEVSIGNDGTRQRQGRHRAGHQPSVG